jgi:short-chain fatty acids transporter
MIRRTGTVVTAVFRRIVPDPLVIAIVLTVVVFVAALLVGRFPDDIDSTVGRASWLLKAWSSGEGLWKLLAFAMQMSLILLGGHVLAEAPPVRRLLASLANLPRTAATAAMLVGIVAMLLGVVNWGLGLIGGAVIARETGRSLSRRGVKAHYPLLAAAGYTGLLVWHGGLSGSAPLSMTTPAGAAKVLPTGLATDAIVTPLSETVFSLENLLITGGLLLIIPVVLALMSPPTADCEGIEQFSPEEQTEMPVRKTTRTLPDLLNNTWWITGLLGLALLVAAISSTAASGIDRIGLNTVIMYLLAAALLLHRSPDAFMHAAARAAAGCAGIIVQFPLYAGIMGIMLAAGLVELLTDAMLGLAGPQTLEFWTMASAGIVNILVPSGGGQWAVQGPIAIEAGRAAGIGTGPMVMAVAYGDELTNMLQPFWALPLLAVTGVRARDIVGYTAIVMVVAAAWMTLWLLVL